VREEAEVLGRPDDRHGVIQCGDGGRTMLLLVGAGADHHTSGPDAASRRLREEAAVFGVEFVDPRPLDDGSRERRGVAAELIGDLAAGLVSFGIAPPLLAAGQPDGVVGRDEP
jgi:hypothetical protein